MSKISWYYVLLTFISLLINSCDATNITSYDVRRLKINLDSSSTSGESSVSDYSDISSISQLQSKESHELISERKFRSKTTSPQELQLEDLFFTRYANIRRITRPITDLEPHITADDFRRNHIAQIVRDNFIYIMGYLLHTPNATIRTFDHEPLEILHDELKLKRANANVFLPIVGLLSENSKIIELLLILENIIEWTPFYVGCATKYLVDRIKDKKSTINLNHITGSKLNDKLFTYGLSDMDIIIAKRYNKTRDVISHDKSQSSNFIELFEILNSTQSKVSQLFIGTFINNLPNLYNNPMNDEYHEYLAEWALSEKIPNWHHHNNNLNYSGTIPFMSSLLKTLVTNSAITLETKKALLFTKEHLLHQTISHINADDRLNLDFLIEMTFTTIPDANLNLLTTDLREYLLSNLHTNVGEILKGINRYKYKTPDDILLAILTRLVVRLPHEQRTMIMIISALLARLMIRTRYEEITRPRVKLSSIFFILDVIYVPNIDTKWIQLIRSLEEELLDTSFADDSFDNSIFPTRKNCFHLKYCAFIVLQRWRNSLQYKSVSDSVFEKIDKLLQYVEDQLGDSVKKNITTRPLENSSLPTLPKPIESTTPSTINHVKLPAISSILQNTPILPLNIEPEDCIVIERYYNVTNTFPNITTSTNPDGSSLILPSIAELQEQPNDNDILEHVNPKCSLWITDNIIVPITMIYGDDFMIKLLGMNWSKKYPTRISALMSLLTATVAAEKIQKKIVNSNVILTVMKTIDILQLICPYLFLPMISHWKQFDVEIIWPTISTRKRTLVVIANAPPEQKESNTLTLPVINPLYWYLTLDIQHDPFPSMLPNLPANSEYHSILAPLIAIFKLSKVVTIIHEQIDLSKFPNIGALFLWTLDRLSHADEVKNNVKLSELISMYLQVIEQSSMYIKIPTQIIVGDLTKDKGAWTVDLIRLMNALPKPRSVPEKKMWKVLQTFFSRVNLLEELGIALPPKQTQSGHFLSSIINTALITKSIVIDDETLNALNYYQDKILHSDAGTANVRWVWFQKIIIETKMFIGEMIETVLPYNQLSRDGQQAYNCLIRYVNRYPQLLNVGDDFPIENYKTTGSFVRGFFKYFTHLPHVEVSVKECIKKLLPHVSETGVGARTLPSRMSLSHFSPKL